MAAIPPLPFWSVILKFFKLILVERHVVCRPEPSHGGNVFWEHAFFALAWGDPDGHWKVLFRLPF